MNTDLDPIPASPSEADPARRPPRRIDLRFMREHPAHWVALGFGSGLSPWAPGTVGTLWGWLVFLALDPLVGRWLGPLGWGLLLIVGLGVGWWACTVTARHAGIDDPGAIVWDEVLAIWLVLWIALPDDRSGHGLLQWVAFGLFRYFDAAKPGPVRWADQHFKGGGWRGGFGILFDDLVAAGCTLLAIALFLALWGAGK